jgi:hypothetical protein
MMTRNALVLLAALMGLEMVAVASAEKPKPEQTHLQLERLVERPVAVPRTILQILRTDPAILQSGCPQKEDPDDLVLASWFEASPIHLHTEQQATSW